MLSAVKSGRFELVKYTPVVAKKNRESEKNLKGIFPLFPYQLQLL